MIDVIFRTDKAGLHKGEVTAVFPATPGSGQCDVSCFAHIGQHSAASRDWYRTTRPALPHEYAEVKRELESAPYRYRLRVVRRWTRRHDAARYET